MKVALLTMAYNEATLLPFFLRHYAWVDDIYLLYDTDSTDCTREIAAADPRVTITDWTFPDGMDDLLKQEAMNHYAAQIEADWIIVADVDEFVFLFDLPLFYQHGPPPRLAPREPIALEMAEETVIAVPFWTVYRHSRDRDLDPAQPPLLQRRHGDPRLGYCYGQHIYIKPMIVRPEIARCGWEVGCHALKGQDPPTLALAHPLWRCAHWCMADPDLAVIRRCRDRRDRMSQANKANKLTVQHWTVTEAEIRAECEEHRHDPQLF